MFIESCDPLFKKGLPFFWREKGAMLTKDANYEKFVARRQDHLNFVDMTRSLTGRIFVDKLADECEILLPSKKHVHTYRVFPTRTTSSYACGKRKCSCWTYRLQSSGGRLRGSGGPDTYCKPRREEKQAKSSQHKAIEGALSHHCHAKRA